MLSELGRQLQATLGDTYRLESEIPAGGMSRLFVAIDQSLHRTVVIKLLPPELASEVNEERFKQEIALTARLRHPLIVPIYAAGAERGFLYYVMPYVRGESLRQRLAREGPLPVSDAVHILREVSDALSYAHAHGVVHRDIKPENILLESDHAVLLDFGIAHALTEARAGGTRLTGAGMWVGTRGYLSPEQAVGDARVDARSDIYALGVVGYEMLAGVPPFSEGARRGKVAANLPESPLPLRKLRPETPVSVSKAIEKALATTPDARFQTAAAFRDALGDPASSPVAVGWTPKRRRAITLLALPLLASVAALLVWSSRRTTLDPNLVVVAPFDVLEPRLQLWREGYVDVLSANLDGAGPLRAVAPTIAVRYWSGQADLPSAAALGRRSGARLAVFGWVVGAGTDSARVTATLIDVATGRALVEVERRDVATRMDRIADSLTVAFLRELGRTRPIGAVRLASLGSTSLPALKEFLQGEQYFRRTAWDSARAHYSRAIALDSTFALALRHMGLTYAWQRFGMDSLARVYALRAGAFNHGVAQRESLLIAADSLRSVMYAYQSDSAFWGHARRLFAILGQATRRYPDDPESWYALADARFHFGVGPGLSVTDGQIFDAFNRAIALDSAFGPAYIHPVELGFGTIGSSLGAQYARAYLARAPTDVSAAGTLLAAKMIDPRLTIPLDVQRTLDTASGDLLYQAYSAARRSLDSAEVAIRLLRLLPTRRPGAFPALADPRFARSRLATQLSYRGHLREAAGIPEARRSGLFGLLALYGAVPADTAAAVFAEWLRSDPRDSPFGTPAVVAALPWWLSRGDTASMRALRRRADSTVRASDSPVDVRLGLYESAAAAAYLTLARHDTSGALEQFAALPDTLCPYCIPAKLTRAQLLAARGRYREAEAILEERLPLLPSAADVIFALERARVAERLGRSEAAARASALVVLAWAHADPELRPIVSTAQSTFERLRGRGVRVASRLP